MHLRQGTPPSHFSFTRRQPSHLRKTNCVRGSDLIDILGGIAYARTARLRFSSATRGRFCWEGVGVESSITVTVDQGIVQRPEKRK